MLGCPVKIGPPGAGKWPREVEGPQNFVRGKIFWRKKCIFVHGPKKCFYAPESAKKDLTGHPIHDGSSSRWFTSSMKF